MALPSSETSFEFAGKFYRVSKMSYSGLATDFEVDQSATSVAVLEPASGAPTVSLGTSDSTTFMKTVTLASGGASGTVTVVIAHGGGSVASTKA
jgi:hypothetical protein